MEEMGRRWSEIVVKCLSEMMCMITITNHVILFVVIMLVECDLTHLSSSFLLEKFACKGFVVTWLFDEG